MQTESQGPTGGRRGITQAGLLFGALATRSAVQFILLLVVVRSSGSTASSNYAIALAISAPIFVTLDMGLRTIYVTARRHVAFGSYVMVRACAVALAVGLSVAVALLYGRVSLVVATLVAIIKAVDSLGDILLAPLQKAGHIAAMSGAIAVNAVLTFCLAVPVLLASGHLELGLLGSLAASIAVTAALLVVAAGNQARPDWLPSLADARYLLGQGLHLGFAYGLASLTVNMPTYVLGALGTASEVTVLALVIYALTAVELVLNAVVQSSLHRLSRRRDVSTSSELLRISTRAATMAGTLLLGAIIAAWLLLEWFGLAMLPTDMRARFGVLLTPVAIAGFLEPFMFAYGAVLSVENRFRVQLWINLVAAVVALTAAAVLIPALGLAGALYCIPIGVAARTVSAYLAARSAALSVADGIQTPRP